MVRLNQLTDLVDVVYSAGKVFDGLSTSRNGTLEFLRTGDTAAVTSRSDVSFLEDFRDLAQLTIDYAQNTDPLNVEFVIKANAQMTRAAAMEPGVLRTRLGSVHTALGHHQPPPISAVQLETLMSAVQKGPDPQENALELFISLAKAQPFGDGNKRTALFSANAILIRARTGTILTIPTGDNDPQIVAQFNHSVAEAYINNNDEPAKNILRTHGFLPVAPQQSDDELNF